MPWLLILLFISGCSGYRYSQQDNPLAPYGIQSLSVPMFYNYSNQPEVSQNFTREVYRLLSTYKGLKLKSGYHEESDAIMIGIVKAPEKIQDTLSPAGIRLAQKTSPNKIGTERQDFYIPTLTNVILGLQIIVIKKPTEEELSLLKSGLGDKVKLSSRVIVNQTIPLSSQFTREAFDNEQMSVTATQNAGVRRKVIRSLSEQAALSVRDLILYAF